VKRVAAAGAVAGLLLLAGLVPTAAAAAAPSLVATGFLAVTTGSGSSQISTFHLDGSGKKPLTSGPANHYDPSLSPDGKQVLFTGEEGRRRSRVRMPGPGDP
jgi:WD40-like Beta Propeller Repeat